MSKKTDTEVAVVVTTEHRGVFFGYTESPGTGSVVLRAGRNCLRWGTQTRGFVGLAVTGPVGSDCRVGPAADMELSGVTCCLRCSDEAVERWESQPWR